MYREFRPSITELATDFAREVHSKLNGTSMLQNSSVVLPFCAPKTWLEASCTPTSEVKLLHFFEYLQLLMCFQIGKCKDHDVGLKAALWWVDLECGLYVIEFHFCCTQI